MSSYHRSVLLQKVIAYLHIIPGKQYIDATLGGGGHTLEILKRGAKVLGIDADEDAIAYASERFKEEGVKESQAVIVKGNFRNIDTIAEENGFTNVTGILFDLGVSSNQLDRAEKGFSFQKDGPLDMRMDKTLGVTAKDLLAVLPKRELYELFTKLGEEHHAFAIARNIDIIRRIKPIETTHELAEIIRRSYRGEMGKTDPSTKVFQALRIAVNDELNSIKEALPKAVSLLGENGRLAVIAFHSLEDRIVKEYFKKLDREKQGNILTKKPIVPDDAEMEENRRSRSAKLRVFEKI